MPRPIVSIIPSRDRALRRVVDAVASQSPPSSPEELASRLRSLFPRVAVLTRQLSGDENHYYVYRDGRFVRDPRDRWWEAEPVAGVTVSATTGVVTRVRRSPAGLMLSQPQELVGRHYTSFVLPEARAAAAAMFEALREGGEVRSEALAVRADGTTIGVEFRAIRDRDEIDVRYRPLA